MDRTHLETSLVEVDREISALIKISKELEVDPATGRVRKEQTTRIESSVKKIVRGIKQAKDYLDTGDKESEKAIEDAESRARDECEKVEDKKLLLEKKFAEGNQMNT